MNGNSETDSSVPRWKQRKRQWVDENQYDDIDAQRNNLPIYRVKKELLQLFKQNEIVILKGDTACGKTTQIPQLILKAGFSGNLAIAVTQPRRVAAISIAERVAQEMRTTLGKKVGYCVRFDDTTSDSTKIKYLTDGMLLRESISDPLLQSYSWVLLDEAHERTIHTDVLFGILKSARKMRKKQGCAPLKLVVMSATIDEEKFRTYFDKAPLFHIPGREYEIHIYNSDVVHEDYALAAVSAAFHIHEHEPEGDILVFLTGEEEIQFAVGHSHKVLKEMPEFNKKLKFSPCALYAALPSQVQCAVLKPSAPGTRKVIYSTNIAETSLTIPGITYVVDSGMVKCRSFNPACGIDVLKVQWVSKAQAEQRMGRAGRQYLGHCYRLYSIEIYEKFEEFPIPEIKRSNLANVLLQLAAIGISGVRTFDFVDKPSDENIDAAIKQLVWLKAVVEDSEGKIQLTEIGKKMVNFPLDPRFSKIIISSPQFKCVDEILTIISLLSVESIFLTSPNSEKSYQKSKERFSQGEGDHVMLLNMFKAFRKAKPRDEWCSMHDVNFKSIMKAVAVRKQLHQICQRIGILPRSCGLETEWIKKCLTTGLFMNSAYKTKKEGLRAIGSKQKVFIHPSSSIFGSKPQCCIYTDLVETSKCYMRNVTSICDEWLLKVAPEYFKHCNFKPFQMFEEVKENKC